MRFRILILLLPAACLFDALFADSLAAVRYYKELSGHEVLVVVPDRQSSPLPLVIALHGCSQSAGEFLDISGLEGLADREGFVLAVPETSASLTNPLACWPWWEPEEQRREGGAASRLAGIAGAMDGDIDEQRVYAVGFSSGAAMAAILAVVYPDVFAAVGIHSGVGFAAAGDTACALDAMDDGPPRPVERGRLGYLHQRIHRVVPVLIIQGDNDDVVNPTDAAALVQETAERNDWIDNGQDDDSFDDVSDGTVDDPGPCRADDCHPHHLQRFEDRDGQVMLESLMVENLGHDWSGGAAGHAYSDPRGPDASALFWRFFDRHRLDPDELDTAAPHPCRDSLAAPWWHFTWEGTMTFAEYTCNMNPWRVTWRHEIDGVSGPGRCP